MKNNKIEDNFEILRNLYKNPDSSQRDLAKKMGLSLGKLNYCLKALKDKGFVKIKKFKKKNKQNWTYKICFNSSRHFFKNKINN